MVYNIGMKNTHLEHLEDDILNSGAVGGFNVVSVLRSFGNMLTGTKSDLSVTTKWDGAPAIICGTDPVTGKFFVGTKSVFNKITPKVCYDNVDVDRFYESEVLRSKLKDCLKYLSQLNIKGIVQGDLLFSSGDKRYASIGGHRVITFNPNAITYAVSCQSSQGIAVERANIGIVFHTVYQGSSIQDCKAVYKAPLFVGTEDIFIPNANFNDAKGISRFNNSQKIKYIATINRAEGSLKRASRFLDIMQSHGQSRFLMPTLFKQFFNNQIRTGKSILNTRRTVAQFAKFYSDRLDAEMNAKTSAKGKERYKQMKAEGLNFIARYQNEIYFTFASYISIRDAKRMVITQLNKVGQIRTYIGNTPTNPEGYVVSTNNYAMKFVDDDFRKANILFGIQ